MKRVIVITLFLLLVALAVVGLVWLLSGGLNGEVMLETDEFSILSKSISGKDVILTVSVEKECYGFWRYECDEKNGVAVIKIFARPGREPAATVIAESAADFTVIIDGASGGLIVHEP